MKYGKLIVEIIGLILIMELVERMGRRDFPKALKYSLMVVLGIVYLVAISSLGFYALAAEGEGVYRRVLAGLGALMCSIFIYQVFKKVVKSS